MGCIYKGKARVRYELGTYASFATSINEGLVVGMRAFLGNLYDGHTLAEALGEVAMLADRKPKLAHVDRVYCGQGVETTKVLISGPAEPQARTCEAAPRRSTIEPEID